MTLKEELGPAFVACIIGGNTILTIFHQNIPNWGFQDISPPLFPERLPKRLNHYLTLSNRYKILGNLPHVLNQPAYLRANGGFSFDYQLINVPDFNGTGESSPSPFFYQNVGEAEYAVAMFMYMRLIGYPAERISILTTYNGQKHLLRDVVNARYFNTTFIQGFRILYKESKK